MPNWCSNRLEVSHEEDGLFSLFVKAAKDEELFSTFCPIPKKIKEDGDAWYDWCIQNWGTKWETSSMQIEEDWKDVITVRFDTAWSPPLAFYGKLEELGFKVRAMYFEPGVAYFGYYADGSEETTSISSISLLDVPDDIDREFNIIDCYTRDMEIEEDEVDEKREEIADVIDP